MSGGHFDYKHCKLLELSNEIGELVLFNNRKPEFTSEEEWKAMGSRLYSEETLSVFRDVSAALHKLYRRIHQIDLLVCGDIDEDSFKKKSLNTWTLRI